MPDDTTVTTTVNGTEYDERVEPRTLLVDYLRHDVGLTGTHRGCTSGQCGACTVLVDGDLTKSCMRFAVQADGAEITTIEGLSDTGDPLHPLQEAFAEEFAVQCGFCTPGMILSASKLLEETPDPSEADVREGISGNICRCTGYLEIIDTIESIGERVGKVDVSLHAARGD